ncbi:ABC transporter permease [Mycoplasmopsis alligatoris]|uniref:Amino acid or sugar ABC transport system, permease protein n=1 Tax=Mycoplasmopsis alligatoris A21JP2 TaxID=747682 RepID=D4XUW7_9BACT|nr:ABC transporter permease [Mycoplasmopsis alligatoris]EFF41807.1 amino acid or sugar ABC transport system, permease protein [Mycoplasmopsis alligatoris A21JP2]
MNKIKNFNDKLSSFLLKGVHNFKSEEKGYARRRMYNSLWAVFFGLLISSIFIIFLKKNPFDIFSLMLTKSIFTNFSLIRNLFAINLIVLIIATLGISIGFKAGLFNIGIPGQMMAGGMLSMVIILTFQKNGITINGGIFILCLVLSLIFTFAIGAFVGFLKSFLNVHEVVATILLNWIILYTSSFLFSNGPAGFGRTDNIGSIAMENASAFSYGNVWPIFLVVAIVLACAVWFVLSKTTIGYRIKMNGLNKHVSKYAGSNEKVLTITLMGTSSMFAGLAGVIYYVIFKQQFPIETQPLLIGFNTIPISLLAYNSPIGLIFSSILFAIMTTANLQGAGITNESTQVIGGLIVYLAALSNIFFNFKTVQFSHKYILLMISKAYWERRYHYLTFKKKRHALYKKDLHDLKLELSHSKEEIHDLKTKLAKLNNGVSLNLKIEDVKTHEDSLNYFTEISIAKKEITNRLIDLKYYHLQEIKMAYAADLKIAKDTYSKELEDIYNFRVNLDKKHKALLKELKLKLSKDEYISEKKKAQETRKQTILENNKAAQALLDAAKKENQKEQSK